MVLRGMGTDQKAVREGGRPRMLTLLLLAYTGVLIDAPDWYFLLIAISAFVKIIKECAELYEESGSEE